MTLWTDKTLVAIEDGDSYTDPDGVQHLAQRDKATIDGLMRVAETPRPDETAAAVTVDGQPRGGVVVTGFRIEMRGDVPTQVWDTRARPALTVAEAQAARIATLTGDCQTAIVGGFTSAALGAAHTYPSAPTDQVNLLGRVAQAQLAPSATFTFWCADADGAWAKRAHTAAQMVAVGQDGAAWVQTCTDKLSGADGTGGLLGQVAAAATVAAVQAVTW